MKTFRPRRFAVVSLSVIILSLFTVFYKSDNASTKNNSALLVPNIQINKTGALDNSAGGDLNNNGVVNPGDRLTYQITVSNTGTDAANVIIQDVLNSNLTLQPGSITAFPIATNDSYNAFGNVRINVPDGTSDLLANDLDPDAGTFSITSPPTTSTNGGEVSINPTTGAFAYNPPAGFEGADTFTYTITDNHGLTNQATVTINVSGMMWFINNNAGACSSNCNGRLTNPFTTLAAFQAINNGTGNNPAANDHIFIYESGTAYLGGITLLNQQKLIGQDTTQSMLSITGINLPPFSNQFPATNTGNAATVNIQNSNAGGSGIALNSTGASGVNVVRGLTVSNSTASSILGNNFGTALIDEVIIGTNGQALSLTNGTIGGAGFSSVNSTGGINNVSLTNINGTLALGGGALSGASGAAFSVSGGNVGITYSGNISKTNASAGALVSIASHTTNNITLSGLLNCSSGCTGISANGNTSGTIEFSNATKNINTGASAAVNLTNNTGATINFTNGGLNIDTTSGAGFTATGGGTVSVTTGTNANTIDTTTGAALNVANTTIGANGLTFRSISSNGGANPGIVLNNTGASGGLTVSGNGGTCSTAANCTGGAIQNKTGDGISLTTTFNPSFNRMFVFNADNSGINGTDVTNATITNSFFDDIGTDFEDSAIAFNTNKVSANNIDGTLIVTGNTMTDLYYSGLDVQGGAGTITQATVSNNIIANTTNGLGINFVGSCTATTCMNMDNADINQNDFADIRGAAIQVQTSTNNTGSVSSNFGVIGDNSKRIDITNNSITVKPVGTHAIAVVTGGPNTGVGVRAKMHFLVECNGRGAAAGCSAPDGDVGVGSSNIGHVLLVGNNGNADMVGTFNNNKVTATHLSGGGGGGGAGANAISGGNGVSGAGNAWTPVLNLTVTNNVVSGTDGNGILLVGRGTSGEATMKINNNNVGAPLSGNRPGIRVDAGNSSSADDDVYLEISGNTTLGSGSSPGIGVRKEGSVTLTNEFGIEGLSPSPANETQTQNHITALNPNSESGSGFDGNPSKCLVLNGNNFTSTTVPFASIKGSDKTMLMNRNLLESSFQTPLEMLARLETFGKYPIKAKTIPGELIAAANAEVISMENTLPAKAESNENGFWENAAAFFGEVSDRLSTAILPTVAAQESSNRQTQNPAKSKTDATAAASAGETVCVDGNSNPNDCAGGFNLPANESTTITFKVTVNSNSTAVTIPNTANVTAAGGINLNSNTVNTTVVHPPTIAKAFGTSSISFGSSATLTFTITNPNPSTNLSGIAFTDNLPAGLVVANPNGLVNNCGGGTITAVADSTAVSVSALSRNAATTCTIVVNVRATSVGEKQNVTGTITSTQSNAGGTAAANLTVTAPAVSGTVSYGIVQMNQPQKFVANVQVAATGASSVSDLTDSSGNYLLENLTGNGQYTVTASKTGNVNGITAFDAVLILRCVAAGAGCTLSNQQKIAADTDNDPNITPFDATQILRYVAANGSSADTGNAGNWKFNPITYSFNPLTGSFSSQNFEAALIGDVDGDWVP